MLYVHLQRAWLDSYRAEGCTPGSAHAPPSWSPPSSGAEAALASVRAWLLGRGAALGGVEVAHSARLGARQLVAAGDAVQGDVLLSVPSGSTLSIATFSASRQLAPLVDRLRDVPDGDMLLDAVPLLYEALVMGRRSAWAPYLATLPARLQLPVNYTAR